MVFIKMIRILLTTTIAILWLPLSAGVPHRGSSAELRSPTGIAVDPTGAVYLTNAADSSISVFEPGARGRTPPVRRIAGPRSGLVNPQGIALDSKGRIYTSNQRREVEGDGSVTVYSPGAAGDVAPVRMLTGRRTGISRPTGLALDGAGKLYVTTSSGPALVFASGADGDGEPESRLPSVGERRNQSFPFGDAATDIAVVPGGGVLVADSRTLTAHLPGGWMRRYTIGDEEGLWAFRPRVAVDEAGELYVAQRSPETLQPNAPPEKGFFSRFSGDDQSVVAVYGPPDKSDTVPRRILGGTRTNLGTVADIAVGRDGALYVLSVRGRRDTASARILVYPPKATGDVAPIRTITGPGTGLVIPTSIAVDRKGLIYVSNAGSGKDGEFPAATITVYAGNAAGDAAPLRTIAGPSTGLNRPAALAVADDGTLYVANADPPGSDQGSITVHPARATGDQPPLRTLTGPANAVVEPRGLAVGVRDLLYVVMGSTFRTGSAGGTIIGSRVNVYPPNATRTSAPTQVLRGSNTGLENPHGVTVDAAGRIYVSDLRSARGADAYGPDLGDISVYRPGIAGDPAPVRTIAGSLTRLNGPGAPAVDRSGNIYVPNRWAGGSGSITVYSPETGGDQRPIRTIIGPTSRLRSPVAVALDAHDTLYVANAGLVTVYAPRADGDVAPVRTIEPP